LGFGDDFFAVLGGGAVAAVSTAAICSVGCTKWSRALKIFKHEPHRTAPLADFKWASVMRKDVLHLGQRVMVSVMRGLS
jgi:hypothetical protein